MRVVLMVGSFAGLLLTLVPSFFVFAGTMAWETHAVLMLVGTVMWFGTAGLWIGKGS